MLKATNYKGLQAAIIETIGKILQRSMHASKHDSIPIQLIYNEEVSLHLKPLRKDHNNVSRTTVQPPISIRH